MGAYQDYPRQSDMIPLLICEIVNLGGWIELSAEGRLLEEALGERCDLSSEQKGRIDSKCNAGGKRAWRNHIQQVRRKAVDAKLIDNSVRNRWEVTEKGYRSIVRPDLMQGLAPVYRNRSGDRLEFEILVSTSEGEERYRLHKTYERDSAFVKMAKQRYLGKSGNMNCETCGFSFHDEYGERGEGYIEAHHNVPISRMMAPTSTNFDDISFLCSNCHRMIHRTVPWITVEELGKLRRA